MQWQLIPETTMHTFDKRFTDNVRNQQTYGSDWSGTEKNPEMTRNGHNLFSLM
jgi:hypothetical protein